MKRRKKKRIEKEKLPLDGKPSHSEGGGVVADGWVGHTIPRLTVSLTRLPSNSSRSVSAESREVVAMRRP